MKQVLSLFLFLSMLLPTLARAADHTPEAAVREIGFSNHPFPRIAHDQSRVAKKRVQPLLNRQCNCKQRCDSTSGYCVIGSSADACSPGEFYPETCSDCVSVKCS